MDYTSVHGILQARILEWVAIPFSKGSSRTRDQTQVSCLADRFFTVWATMEAQLIPRGLHIVLRQLYIFSLQKNVKYKLSPR